MAIINVIKYEGGNNVLVWKHPREDFNTSAQLIVHESQEAFIYRDGQMSAPYTAGKHTIQTENLPGIRRIVGLVTGGISPNHYEVYYVNKATSMDVYWGASPWILQDTSLQVPFKMQARGQFSVSVLDARTLLLKLVGTTTSFTQETLKKYFSGIMISRIKDFISNTMISERLSYATINTKLAMISEKVSPQVAAILRKYGLALEEFVVEGISIVEDEIYEGVRKAQEIRVTNEMIGISEIQKRGFEVAQTQAANQGTGGQFSSMMAGLAAGAAIGPAIGNFTRNAMQSIETQGPQANVQRAQYSVGVVEPQNGATREIVCAKCGAKVSADSRFCNQCGSKIESQSRQRTISCPSCGAQLSAESKFCNICGAKL